MNFYLFQLPQLVNILDLNSLLCECVHKSENLKNYMDWGSSYTQKTMLWFDEGKLKGASKNYHIAYVHSHMMQYTIPLQLQQ